MTLVLPLPVASTSYDALLRKLLLEEKNCTLATWNAPDFGIYLLHGVAKRLDPMRKLNFSLLNVCPRCSKDWLRIDLHNEQWLPVRMLCPQHGKGYMLPWEVDYWVLLPSALLRREILLLDTNNETKQGYRAHLVTGGL